MLAPCCPAAYKHIRVPWEAAQAVLAPFAIRNVAFRPHLAFGAATLVKDSGRFSLFFKDSSWNYRRYSWGGGSVLRGPWRVRTLGPPEVRTPPRTTESLNVSFFMSISLCVTSITLKCINIWTLSMSKHKVLQLKENFFISSLKPLPHNDNELPSAKTFHCLHISLQNVITAKTIRRYFWR